MKLKEKLAKEFSNKDLGDSEEQIPAYLAGFEKARGLALKVLDDYSYEPDGDNSRFFEGRDIDLEIKKLGEEEVD